MSKGTQKEEFECKVCGLSFDTKKEYDNHILAAHRGGANPASEM